MKVIAFNRTLQGSGASRRLRTSGQTPGIIYGGAEAPALIALDGNALYHALKKEAFHGSVLDMEIDGKTQQVLLRDFQMHPVRNTIQHIDFQRVSASEKIHVKVPFHFTNAEVAPGVKLAHGVVTHVMTEADVSCLPKNLPEFIEVDLSQLEAGHSIHLSELKLPKGVEFVQLAHGDDAAVASIPVPRGGVAAEEEEAAAPEAPAAE